MKRARRRIFGLLMTCLMVCLPVMQALAQTYDASVMDPMTVLFPGDDLTGIVTPLMLDGEQVVLDEGVTTWMNDSEDKVYSAATAEDGSLQLALAGYELDVTGGTSVAADETLGPVGGHYEMTPEEEALLDPEAPQTDRAYYPAYTIVKIKADEPKEGMAFEKWTVEPEDVVLEDELNSETTVTLPEKKVSITANYCPVQAEEAPADPGAEGAVDPNAGGAADPGAEGAVDPNAGGAADPGAEGTADPNTGVVVDPSVEGAADPNAGVVVDPSVEGTADPNAGVVVDPSVEDTADPNAGVVVDPSVEDTADPNTGIVIVQGDDTGADDPTDSIFDSIGDDGAFPVTTNDEYNSDPNGADMIDNVPEPVETVSYTLEVYRGIAEGENAAGTVPESYSIPAGNTVTVVANDYSANGYTFDSWTVEAETFTLDLEDNIPTTSFVMPEENVSLTAQYVDVNGTPVSDPEVKPILTRELTVNSGTATVDDVSLALPGEVEVGEMVTVTAEDNTAQAHRFTGWTASTIDAATGNETPAEITLIEGVNPLAASFEMPDMDLILTAGYEPIPYTVTMANEDGTVTAEDATQGQTASFTAGTVVTVEARDKTADSYEFTGWEVSSDDGTVTAESVGLAVDSENPYKATFQMPAMNVTVTAVYNLIQPVVDPTYKVTVTYGTVDVQGTALAEGSFKEGDTVTITAADRTAEKYQFSDWTVTTGNASLADAKAKTTSFTMPKSDVNITANYSLIPEEPAPTPTYTLTVSGGVLTAAGTTTGSYAQGTVVPLQANAPAMGMKFSRWSAKTDAGATVADSAFTAVGEATTSFTVPASNVTVTAEYVPITYKVKVKDGSADCEKAAGGTKVTITADEAPAGMEFDYWEVVSGNVSLKNASKATTSFTMPYAKVEVSAYYRMKEYHVTVQNGKASGTTYYMGDQVTVYSNYPASGREFDCWKAVSGKVTFADSSRWKTTFTMPASDVTVSAAYKDGPSPNNNQIWDLVAGGEYITDSTIKFTAVGAGMDNSNPNPGDYRYRPIGYQIGNVTGSWQASPYTTSMSIKARGEYTLKVNFAKDIFDGTNWAPDGTTDTRSVTFRVLTPEEAVATGDRTPIQMMIVLAGASCLMFLLLLSMFIRRRKNS